MWGFEPEPVLTLEQKLFKDIKDIIDYSDLKVTEEVEYEGRSVHQGKTSKEVGKVMERIRSLFENLTIAEVSNHDYDDI